MSRDPQPKIRLKPFLKGDIHQGRVVIRTYDGPYYLSMSAQELNVLDQMVGLDISIETYVKWHLAGQEGLSFREAVALVSRLNAAHFLEDDRAESAMPRLEELTSKGQSPLYLFTQKLGKGLAQAFNLELLAFDNAHAGRPLRRFDALLTSTLGFVTILLAALYFAPSFQSIATYGLSAFRGLLRTPEALVAQAYVAFLAAATVMSILKVAAIAGTGAQFMPCSLRLLVLCIPVLRFRDEDALLLPSARMMRYWGFQLIIPWVLGAVFWQMAGPTFFQILACAFLMIGLVHLCPLYHGPLIRLCEGMMGMRDVLQVAKLYLGRQLLKNLWKRPTNDSRNDLGNGKSFGLFLTGFACATLIWLYGTGLFFADTLFGSIPAIWQHFAYGEPLSRRFSAALILTLLTSSVALMFVRLFLIVAENLVSVAELPARKARQGIESFYRTYAEPSEALTAFFRDIPIFSHLSETQIMAMTQKLQENTFRKGQAIIKQGEDGEQFFIVGAGEAQVVIEHPNGWKELVGVLKPGDSFGEIALIDNCVRTATVRASDSTKMFILEKSDFDTLFPEDSSERKHLTYLIRRVKLILDSQALSHLNPSQIRELLRCADQVEFKPGDTIVREGDIGDAAYLIEIGKAKVCLPGNEMPAAYLQKGDLVGIISLIKGIKRTADVVAETSVTALKIDRAIFLRVCMSDVFVAMLMSDLSDKQLAKRKAA